jgi:hypothetical protein
VDDAIVKFGGNGHSSLIQSLILSGQIWCHMREELKHRAMQARGDAITKKFKTTPCKVPFGWNPPKALKAVQRPPFPAAQRLLLIFVATKIGS